MRKSLPNQNFEDSPGVGAVQWTVFGDSCWSMTPHAILHTHRGSAGRGQPCDLRKHTHGSSGGTGWPKVTHSAPARPCEEAGLQNGHCHLHPWAVSLMFVVQVLGSGMLAAWELLPRVYGQQQLHCATITSFKSCRQGSTHRAFTWLQWGLAVTHWL